MTKALFSLNSSVLLDEVLSREDSDDNLSPLATKRVFLKRPSFEALGAQAISQFRSKSMTMHLTELKQKPVSELMDMAREMSIDNVGRSRKQEVILSLIHI